METFDTITKTVVIPAGQTGHASQDGIVYLPDGNLVNVGAVSNDTTGQIINFSLLQDGNDVIKPADLRFSTRTSGGSFRDSLRPISNVVAGRQFEVKVATLGDRPSAAEVVVQVLFVIQKNLN